MKRIAAVAITALGCLVLTPAVGNAETVGSAQSQGVSVTASVAMFPVPICILCWTWE